MPENESLSSKVVKGGFWVFATRIFERGLGFIRIIILARILSPNDFGLFGILLLSISTLETFSQTGFQSALVQKKEKIESYLDTAWTILAVRGLILYTLLFFSAPLIAEFFDASRASFFIRIVGITTLFRGFSNIGTVYFQKEIRFNKKFILQLVTNIVEFIVAVILAYTLKNVWALVISQLIGGFSGLITGYIIHPYRPKFQFDKKKAKELFTFGKWITGSGIIIFIATQGDDIFLGKILGATALGIYQLSYKISNSMATEVTHLISKVTFPAYSKIKDNSLRLKNAFTRTFSITTMITFLLSTGILLLIPEFVNIFLKEKWAPIIIPVRILSIAGLLRSISAIFGPLFLSLDKPNYDLYKNMIRVIITFSSIYFLTISCGIKGTSYSVLLGIIGALISDLYLFKILPTNFELKNILKPIYPISIGILFMSVAIIPIKIYIDITLFIFILLVILSIILYLSGIYLYEKWSKISLLKNFYWIYKIIVNNKKH